MKTLLAILVGAFVGLIGAYFCGAFLGCWLFPTSNLCGIYGVGAAPIGFIIGAICGWLIARRKSQT